MSAVMTVDLSELDAWSAQVDRASHDLQGISRNGSANLGQSDFGAIFETMMGAYNGLLPRVNDTLTRNATGVHDHHEALRATARDFVLTEDGIVARHLARSIDARDGSSRFGDVAETAVRRARPTESSLPQVSFGFPYDTVCDLIRMFTGFDIRAELAEKIGGDVVSASRQGSAFGNVAQSMQGVARNLESGNNAVSSTWQGTAAEAAQSQMGSWISMIDEQAGRLYSMGQSLVQICRDAWQTAQAVVECIKSAVQTVSSALATASIPGVGWARIARAVMQAFKAVMKAFQVLKKFINILKQLKNLIEAIGAFFDGDDQPVSQPGAPAATGQPTAVLRDPRTIATPTIGSASPAPASPAPAGATTGSGGSATDARDCEHQH